MSWKRLKDFWVNERYLQKDDGANGPFGKGFISYNPVAIDLLQAFDILSMFQLNIWWLYQQTMKCCFFISRSVSAGSWSSWDFAPD